MNEAAINHINKGSSKISTKEISYVGLCIALMAICSWISIPMAVPFTMQTFAINVTAVLLGAKLGTLAVIGYLALGAMGAPVFAGFSGGLGVIFGSTGGYLIGFIFTALIIGLFVKFFGKSILSLSIGMVLGTIACYIVGTIWFIEVYTRETGAIDLMTALQWCVFPFIISGLGKIALSIIIVKRLEKHVHL